MRRTRNRRRKQPFVGLAVAMGCLAFVTYLAVQRLGVPPTATYTGTPPKTEESTQEKPAIGTPVRIMIPKINVDAVLEYVGRNPEGEMEEPTKAENAAWFNRRPLPGEAGTSVIAGHFGLRADKPAVFDNLHKLREGDEIHIKDSKRSVIVFIVQELRTYTPEQDATDVFESDDGKSYLNLITCKGAWNESLQSYDTRLVVFAAKK